MKLGFSGDFAPLIEKKRVPDNAFIDIMGVVNGFDLHITNLETPLSDGENPIVKIGPALRAGKQFVSLLTEVRVDLACLSNNHIFDYGEQGILDTIEVCNNNGIAVVGIKNYSKERVDYCIKEIRGIKIAFINYCEHEFSVRSSGELGACGFDPYDAYTLITRLKQSVDHIIVVYHGGNEFYTLPNPTIKKIFHYLVDIGSSAVICHHSHVISGYEYYKEKPIVYSLGNFFFPSTNEPDAWHYGLIAEIKLGGTVELELHPIVQCVSKLEVLLLKGDQKKQILEKVERLSQTIKHHEELEKCWEAYCKENGKKMAVNVLIESRFKRLLFRYGIISGKSMQRRALRISNIVTCLSLREVLLGNLKSLGRGE